MLKLRLIGGINKFPGVCGCLDSNIMYSPLFVISLRERVSCTCFGVKTAMRHSFLFSDSALNESKVVKAKESENNQKNLIKKKSGWGNLKYIKAVYFQERDFEKGTSWFGDKMSPLLVRGSTYSLLIRFNYVKNDISLFSMLGPQIGICTDGSEYEDEMRQTFEDVRSTIKSRLDFYREKYRFKSIQAIQVMYIVNDSLAELKTKNVRKIRFDKNITNVSENQRIFNEKVLPLTTDERYYGAKLKPEIEKGYIDKLYIEETELISLIRKHNANNNNVNKGKVDDNRLFSLLLKKETRFYFRSVGADKYVIAVMDVDLGRKCIHIFNIKGYTIVQNIEDKIYDLNLPENFERTCGNTKIIFKNGVVDRTIVEIKLPLIRLKSRDYKTTANPYIGSFDTETYVLDDNSSAEIYSLGFSNLSMMDSEKKTSMYYLTRDGETSSDIIGNCLHDMFKDKNSNHIYYTHNLGGFDAIFILHYLFKINKQLGFKHYKISNTIFRNEKILKFTLKIPSEFKDKRITFVDSYNLLISDLDSLSKCFGSSTKKGCFPYDFVKKNTLNYIGNTPEKKYYNQITDSQYLALYKDNWSLKDESLKYLEQDLLSLLEVMDNFNRYIFINYNVQVTDSLTISRLSLNIFLKNYLGRTQLPVIQNKAVFSDIKKAYYGGVVEVYKPYGRNLYFYDVNSLYPSVALNPMPGHKCEFWMQMRSAAGGYYLDLYKDDLFGFFYCKVNTNNVENKYLGLLPVHKEDGTLIMPNGEWCGWYFSEELKYAKEKGYDVEIYKGYKFNKVYNVFDKYVLDLYEKKSNSSGSSKLIVKYLLNSLLGRFGLDINRLTTEIVSLEEYKEILATRECSFKKITDDDILVSYVKEVSQKICNEHGLNFVDVLNRNSKIDLENVNHFHDVAISISAAVSSYARIYMNKVKLDVLNKGGSLYYTDTDSIVTNCRLPSHLVGNGLGEFKLLSGIKEGYFISAKTYCLIMEEGDPIIVAKGVSGKESLTVNDFIKLYNKENILVFNKQSEKDFSIGSVLIKKVPLTLDHDSYRKRVKIFDENNVWIDTKPVWIFNSDNEMETETIQGGLYLSNIFKDLSLIRSEIYIHSLNILIRKEFIYVTPEDICLNWQQFYNLVFEEQEKSALSLFKVKLSSLTEYLLYMTPSGIALDYQQFCSNKNIV